MGRIIAILLISLVAILVFIIVKDNKDLQLSRFIIHDDRLPDDFNNFVILHLSDIHNEKFGINNERLMDLTRKSRPDLIFITGDLIDSRRTNLNSALDVIDKISGICPIFFVPGNHESRVQEYVELKKKLKEKSVIVLENNSFRFEKDGTFINIIGLMDADFEWLKENFETRSKNIGRKLRLLYKKDMYNILLSHRPEFFNTYAEEQIDLVFSGHAHGGQFRLPFVKGLYAPQQGLFPKYSEGIYVKDRTKMIVSRGMGNSNFPFRFNNRPEIIRLRISNIEKNEEKEKK